MDLVEQLLTGNRRALAKVISLIEDESENKRDILQRLYNNTGKGYVVGITGSPGSGKSSLVDSLTGQIRREGKTVGVIAVDPTSPFTGGALLGDRIRMGTHVLDEGVFIRSMGTRGSLGGLARTTKEAIKAFDAFGKDLILVETVGVGQSELDVMNAVDTTVVVLTPGAGDSIQTMKAGIMEIADIFVVNKADLEGAARVVTEVENMLDMDSRMRNWRPPVLPVIAISGEGIDKLYQAISNHRSYLEDSGELYALRRKRLRGEVMDIILEQIRYTIMNKFRTTGQFEELVEKVLRRETDPYTAAGWVIKDLTNGEALKG